MIHCYTSLNGVPFRYALPLKHLTLYIATGGRCRPDREASRRLKYESPRFLLTMDAVSFYCLFVARALSPPWRMSSPNCLPNP